MEVTLRTCQSVPFYACGGFDPSVCAHGFSTRLGGVSPAPWDSLNLGANRGDAPERVAENFRRFCPAVGGRPRRPGEEPSGPRGPGAARHPERCDVQLR
ncbi:MAG: laccase domain-containing protein [Eubacteriales bacterium]